MGVVYEWVTVCPRLHGVRVGDWLVAWSRWAILLVGVVGTWSGCSHGSAERLANVVWMVFGDMSVSANAQADSVEFGLIGRHLASKWWEELGQLRWCCAECSEKLYHLSLDRHGELAFDGRSLSADLVAREQ